MRPSFSTDRLDTLDYRIITDLAIEAGRLIMEHYEEVGPVIQKEDRSPLTAADQASHQYLTTQLSELNDGIPVVSEEDPELKKINPGHPYWLIDPLDGTKEFIKQSGEFTVNIALMINNHPALGVIHAPAIHRTYAACRQQGAWRSDDTETWHTISTAKANPDALRIVGSRDHKGPLLKRLLQQFPQAEMTSMGSSLKFCLVAEGSADVYLRDLPTMEWDTGAAQCIVETAGGRVLKLDGETLNYGKPDRRNPAILTSGDGSLDPHELNLRNPASENH